MAFLSIARQPQEEILLVGNCDHICDLDSSCCCTSERSTISAILCQGCELQPDYVTVPVHLIAKDLKLHRRSKNCWKKQTDQIKKQSDVE